MYKRQEKDYDSVFITLDKMDKIGLDGVAAEMKENGYAEESVEKKLKQYEMCIRDSFCTMNHRLRKGL